MQPQGTHSPLVGVWDQVLAFGQYQHVTVDGKPVVTEFDASSCKVMLDDFARHPESDVFVDKQHEIVDELGDRALDRAAMKEWAEGDGHAMAWANALAMVIAGQVVRYEPHPGAPPQAPPAEDILRLSDGSLRGDGVYALRSAVTERGADPKDGLPVFRFTSPYFIPERDGYRLLNYTATNDPRMRGAALAFSREGRIAMSRVSESATSARGCERGQENQMDKELMARAGCMESDSPAAQIEKMAGYIRKMEDEGRKKDEEQAMARQKMQAMESDMDAMKRAMESKPFEGKETKEEEKKEREAMSRRLSALEEKNSMYVREIADLKARSTAADDLVGKAKDREAKEFAQDAIAMGRIRGDHKGDIQKTTEWLAGKYKADKDGAEDILSAAGTFQPDERAAMSRLGAKPRDERDNDGDSLDAQTDRAISDAVKELRAKGEQPTTAQAMSRAREKNPDLFKQWERRPGGQLA